jgi:hypothetical protein
MGAVLSLILTFVLGRKAMRLHEQSSIFIDKGDQLK